METVTSYYACMPKFLNAVEVNASLENAFGDWYGYNFYDEAGNPWANLNFWDERDVIFAKLRWPELKIRKSFSGKLPEDWDGLRKYRL